MSDRERLRLLQVALVAALATGLIVHAWDGRTMRSVSQAPRAQPLSVRFSLAAQTGRLSSPIAGRPVVTLTLIVSNHSSIPVKVLGVDVSGPGAGLVASSPGGPPLDLPQSVDPGEETTIRFGMSSDCSVAIRPPPTVTFTVQPLSSSPREVVADIPGLDSIWGLTLLPGVCPAGPR
jgi:hypothetical protein